MRSSGFVFITGVTRADNAVFSLQSGSGDSKNGVHLDVGGQGFDVKFSTGRGSTITGNQTEALFNVGIYKLQKTNANTNGSGYQFFEETRPQFSITPLFNSKA